MTEYLKAKWQRLRIMKIRGMAEINYRIIRLELKMRGGSHVSSSTFTD